MPSIEAWLEGAVADVTRGSREGVRPVLEALAQAGATLRRAEWNPDASRDVDRSVQAPARAARRG